MKWRGLARIAGAALLLMTVFDMNISKCQTQRQFRLMPYPARLIPGEGKLVVDSNFSVGLTGHTEPGIAAAVTRAIQRLADRTGITLASGIEKDAAHATLQIHCAAAGEAVQTPAADESYELVVTPSNARLTAPTSLGVLRGLETVLQLVDSDAGSFLIPVLKIEDRPRFPWRGLLIDVARHWQPMEILKRNLDGMAAVKLNVLHLHLSDDQGFRVESRTYPRLHTMGSDGNFFTQAQVAEIVAYARARGIRVVPEFDMPGHTASWFVGHPELASAPGPYVIERSWGVFDPCLDPTREEVYTFLDRFIGEMTSLFPDQYFHIGGDEVNGRQWDASGAIRAFKEKQQLKDNRALQAYFTGRLLAIVTKHGKKMIGWDEILDPAMPKDVVIQSWRGQDSLAQAARQGFSGILSAGWYLDHMLTSAAHYAVDPIDKAAAGLSAAEQARILGGEACMWSEFVTPENIDLRVWPRTAAIAERLWSPAAVRDPADMYRRLEFVSRELELLGLTHRSVRLKMLERIAGENPVEPLRVLVDVLEPVKYYERGQTHKYTSFTPLNRPVDAASPESDAARRFAQLVDAALARRSSPGAFRDVRARLLLWRDNDALLQPALRDSFLLKDMGPVSQSVSALAGAGLQALDYVEAGTKPPATWRQDLQPVFEQPKRPESELLIMIIPAVRKLVDAVP